MDITLAADGSPDPQALLNALILNITAGAEAASRDYFLHRLTALGPTPIPALATQAARDSAEFGLLYWSFMVDAFSRRFNPPAADAALRPAPAPAAAEAVVIPSD